jgi:hypothetical protein
MVECSFCGQEMQEARGCTREVVIFDDGTQMSRIPWGDDKFYRTYDERVDMLEREIENGGRGRLSADDIREDLQKFQRQYSRVEYNNRRCHDCGATVGEYHHIGCDQDACPRCGGQFFVCDCVTESKKRLWSDIGV